MITTDIKSSRREGVARFFVSGVVPAEVGDCCSAESPVRSAGEVVKPTVLVVDDEELIADSLAEILNRNGYDATALYSSVAAIMHLANDCPDFVVSDVVMPECNGIQLAIAVREKCPAVRILLFSGNESTRSLLHLATNDGYQFDVLAKPVHPTQLLKALQT